MTLTTTTTAGLPELSVGSALAAKTILLTGVTGFLGKVILEKLLFDGPGGLRILLLLRGSSSNASPQDRFEREVLSSSAFDRLRKRGDLTERLKAIECVGGEMTMPMLGLEPADFEQLGRRLDLIINSAASVDFRKALDKALKINTLSLNSLVDLANVGGRCRFVQVSTCYVHGLRSGLISERNNPPVRDGGTEADASGSHRTEDLVRHLERMAGRMRSSISDPQAAETALTDLGAREARKRGWNDTYTMTKWLGEQLLFDAFGCSGRLSVVSPAIIESTLAEPVRGWIEGVKVADALIMAYAREKVTFFPGNREAVIDIIPADLVANAIIIAAAELFTLVNGRRIYQVGSSNRNPVRIREVVSYISAEAQSNHAAYSPLFRRRPQKPFIVLPRSLFGALLTAAVFSSRLRGWLPGASVEKQKKIDATSKLAMIFSFYTDPDYRFDMSETLALAERLSAEDKRRYPVDPAGYEWEPYIRKIHLPGLNRYGLKQVRPTRPEPELDSTELDLSAAG